METPSASIKLRLPAPFAITMATGFGILFFYLVTVILSFLFQDAIESVIGINPAKISIIILLIVLFIPWAILAWGIFQKYSKIGTLNLYTNYLTINNAEKQVIKNYPAQAITVIKIQNLAAHFEFRDGYRFNILSIGMDKNYTNELSVFHHQLLNFIDQNHLNVQKGRIL